MFLVGKMMIVHSKRWANDLWKILIKKKQQFQNQAKMFFLFFIKKDFLIVSKLVPDLSTCGCYKWVDEKLWKLWDNALLQH